MMPMGEIVLYSAMCRAIAECHAVDEVKDIRDKAMALEHYAKQAMNLEAERQACEVRLRAERKAGELLKRMDKAQGKRTDLVAACDQVEVDLVLCDKCAESLLWKCPRCDHVWDTNTTDCKNCLSLGHESKIPHESQWFVGHPEDGAKTLAELGISKTQSSRWQRLADVPEQEFEAALAGPEKPSTSGLIKPKNGKTMNEDALWLWGRFRDLESMQIMEHHKLSSLLDDMTDAMRSDVERIVVSLRRWLDDE